MITISNSVLNLCKEISLKSLKETKQYLPIDRFFLEENGYLKKIEYINYLEFLFVNLENVNNTYTIQLFLCLPELWERVTYDDLLTLIENFTNSFSFYTLVEFTHKYLKIDLLDEIFKNDKVKSEFKRDCAIFFPRIVASFYMSEDDYDDFNNNLFGINTKDWDVVREHFLNDYRIKPVLEMESLTKKLKELKDLYGLAT